MIMTIELAAEISVLSPPLGWGTVEKVFLKSKELFGYSICIDVNFGIRAALAIEASATLEAHTRRFFLDSFSAPRK